MTQHVIEELGARPEDHEYMTLYPFSLRIIEGTPVDVEPGQRVRLRPETGTILVKAGRVEPVSIPPEGLYMCVQGYLDPGDGGQWRTVWAGEIVTLTRAEAVTHMLRGEVEPVDGHTWRPCKR